MSGRAKVIIHVGGHDFHPVYEQAALLTEWLAPFCWCHTAESLAALEHLGECDLLVFMGMYYTGWEGRYRAPGDPHKRQVERYVASGGAMVFAHGAMASYDDWPRFAELAGFSFAGRRPTFALPGEYLVGVTRDDHDNNADANADADADANANANDAALRRGVENHVLLEAPPVDVRIAGDIAARVHASIARGADGTIPMWVTGRGGRVGGAGKTALIGAGHDLRGFAHPMTRQIWINTARWCLHRDV